MIKKYLKLKIFIELVLLTSVVIFINRQISQSLLMNQIENLIIFNMADDLARCDLTGHDNHEFIHCVQDFPNGEIFNSMKSHYIVCPIERVHEQASVCGNFREAVTEWDRTSPSSTSEFQFSRTLLNEDEWLAVKTMATNRSEFVLLNKSWVTEYVKQIWGIRDLNTLKTLPFIFSMMIGLSLYLVYSVLKPVKLIAEKISQLNDQNLTVQKKIISPYREFDVIVDQYDNLRERLARSFEKARRFSGDASHELRTPLSILRGATERIIGDLPVGSDAQIQVRFMGDEIERLINITEKLLLLSQADANILKVNLNKSNLSDVLGQFVEDALIFNSSLAIKHEIQKGIIWECDIQLICQLMHNLYTNAVKYNKPKGWIDFKLIIVNGHVNFTLENTTIDIPNDLEKLAFDRFFRGDASRTRAIDGLGLGLSICQEIARAHKGKLSLCVTPQNTVRLDFTAPLH
jgi:signal transduction histidine kinase